MWYYSGSHFIPLHTYYSKLKCYFKVRVLLKAASFILLRDRFKDIMFLLGQEQPQERNSTRPNPSLLCIYMYMHRLIPAQNSKKPKRS
jgi:hypothetical protein